MKSIKKIAIIGVGFMGASLALALKKRWPKIEINGYARSQKSLNKLKSLKVVDRVSGDLKEVVGDADIVILSAPIYAIIKLLRSVSCYLKKGATVIDLGSTKDLVQKQAKKILARDVYFVGCHPLCGSEKSGAEFSNPDLYKGAVCVLTHSWAKCRHSAQIKQMWEELGSKVIFLDARTHDRIVSAFSHLPHAISFVLSRGIAGTRAKFTKLSLPSLSAMLRIAGSPPDVWADIFLSNKRNVVNDIDKFLKALKELRNAINSADRKKIVNFIKEANKKYNLVR